MTAEKPHSFWKTVPGILTAIAGIIGSLAALITALHTVGIIGAPASNAGTPKTATVSEKPVIDIPVVKKPVNVPTRPKPDVSYSAFHGRYTGISYEGFDQIPFENVLTRNGNRVTGIYSLAGQRGSISGFVDGNTMHYDWRAGDYSGKGIAIEKNGYVEGIWGYGNSTDNGGTSVSYLAK